MRTNVSSALYLPSRFSLLLLCAAMAVPTLTMSKSVIAQEAAAKKYNVLPFDPALKRDLNIPRIGRGDDGWKIADHRPYVEQYLNTYTFAEMTLPENVQRLPELRQLFFKKIWQAKDMEAYKAVNEITLKAMQNLVNPKNNFHPAVQYNAILLLGDLDNEPRTAGGRQAKPVPWAGAMDTLIKCATLSAFPDHVRAGALIGLERQAEFGLTPDNRDSITSAARLIIQEKTPPQGRNREVHDWMRRRACEILGFAGQVGGDNNVPILLIDAMNDPQATLAFRCSAAHALGKLRYEGALGIDTKKLSAGMGDLALAICNETKAKAKTTEDTDIAQLVARQASVRLSQLKTGFVAPTTIGGAEDISLAKDVSTQVELLLTDLQSGKVSPTVLDDTTHQIALRLGKAVAPAVTPEAAPSATTPGTPTPAKEATPAIPDPGDDAF
jgi:hypothetical protein